MKNCFCVLFAVFFLNACTSQRKQEKDLYAIRTTDDYLTFPIDVNTRLPKFILWTFEENGKGYLAFPNMSKEILFYDISSMDLVKKVEFDAEGNNGVGSVYGFQIKDFNNIYIASPMLPIIYVADTTGRVKSKIEYEEADDGTMLAPALVHTITYSPMYFIGDSLYIPQTRSYQLKGNSPYGVMIDLKTNHKTVTPLKFQCVVKDEEIPRSTGGGKVSVCYNGGSFIYSSEVSDSIYELSRDFSDVKSFLAKSRYLKSPKVEVLSSDVDVEMLLKRKCELPAYGNLIYDKYRNVYYRFVFPEVELDKERSYLDIYHNGRKQFSIMVLDKDFQVVGETLFPEYSYNANIFFIREDGLYISVSHFKRPDFDENLLRFQKFELTKMNI
ncbi:DUF4221 family protein [Bacteroides sp. UBA939]|uniref:DUF4221 family protein n=1 Tax=Bacteroides sp. UBA939 TaxID=1946092 RepID=UPI0025C3B507|nr:DUF4221 family protein [Bacteroides sp. UBA939]